MHVFALAPETRQPAPGQWTRPRARADDASAASSSARTTRTAADPPPSPMRTGRKTPGIANEPRTAVTSDPEAGITAFDHRLREFYRGEPRAFLHASLHDAVLERVTGKRVFLPTSALP